MCTGGHAALGRGTAAFGPSQAGGGAVCSGARGLEGGGEQEWGRETSLSGGGRIAPGQAQRVGLSRLQSQPPAALSGVGGRRAENKSQPGGRPETPWAPGSASAWARQASGRGMAQSHRCIWPDPLPQGRAVEQRTATPSQRQQRQNRVTARRGAQTWGQLKSRAGRAESAGSAGGEPGGWGSPTAALTLPRITASWSVVTYWAERRGRVRGWW